MLTIKDHIAGTVEFQYYRAGNLMYKTSTGLEFPVPISDTNDATFPRVEKGIFFMRWIRKHLATNTPTNTITIVGNVENSVVAQYTQSKFTP